MGLEFPSCFFLCFLSFLVYLSFPQFVVSPFLSSRVYHRGGGYLDAKQRIRCAIAPVKNDIEARS